MFSSEVKVTVRSAEKAVVGAIRVASKLGGLNVKEWLQPRKHRRCEVALAENHGKPTHLSWGKADDCR